MTTFHFRAVAADGKPRVGTLTGASERVVARELRRQGLTPVYVGPEPGRAASFKLPALFRGRRKDVLYFTQELHTLLNSGIPLDRALAISTELTEREHFQSVIQDVLRTLKGGKSFADSLATHPEYFGSLYVNMVRAGEASGALSIVFERLTEFERTRDDFRNYIISSMVYPALLTLVGFGSIGVLLYFVVPRFARVFEETRIEMPFATKMLIEVSGVVQTYGLWVLAALGLFVFGMVLYVRSPAGRHWWDGFRLKLPLLGDSVRKAETARFARAMATLVENNVPLVQSIQIAGATLLNTRISEALGPVAQGVKRGEGIAEPVKRAKIFPPLAGHLLSVGEETGQLDKMFERMAEVYETETRESIKRFTSLFEPLVILIMGVIVGALILSMLLAITSINEVAI